MGHGKFYTKEDLGIHTTGWPETVQVMAEDATVIWEGTTTEFSNLLHLVRLFVKALKVDTHQTGEWEQFGGTAHAHLVEHRCDCDFKVGGTD